MTDTTDTTAPEEASRPRAVDDVIRAATESPPAETTPEEATAFFVQLITASLGESTLTNPAEVQKTLEQAAALVDSFRSLAHAFLIWSEAPKSPCPNYLLQTFLTPKVDGTDGGCVEIVLRRVRPGGESFGALAADAVRAKVIRAAAKSAAEDWRAPIDGSAEDGVNDEDGAA